MNKIKVDITCPVLELPFTNNPQTEEEAHQQKKLTEEKWIMSMGNLQLSNYSQV